MVFPTENRGSLWRFDRFDSGREFSQRGKQTNDDQTKTHVHSASNLHITPAVRPTNKNNPYGAPVMCKKHKDRSYQTFNAARGTYVWQCPGCVRDRQARLDAGL